MPFYLPRRFIRIPGADRIIRTAGAAALCIALAACGGNARDHARMQIKQANQSFTADDFIKAAARGDEGMVQTFLLAGMERNVQDNRGYTALMAAAETGKIGVLKPLLDENAKTEVQNKQGSTALILAAAADQPDSVRMLIEANADVRAKDSKNWTALMKAVYDGHARLVDVLLATSRDQLAHDGQLDRALSVAALLGNDGIVRALLDHGANINAAIENRQTALMYAATTGKRETLQLLLSRGADTRLVNGDGATASILALQRGHPELSKLIDSYAPPGAAATIPAVATGATPAPLAVTDEQAKQAAADAASMKLEHAWLKQNNIEPASLLKKDTGQDDDGDGFTNDEELAAGTDPNDPKSHPPYYTKLRMKKLQGDPFPVIFDGIEGKKVRVSLHGSAGPDRQVDLNIGEHVPSLPYTVTRVHRRDINEKDTGRPLDVSELTLSNTDTGEKMVLVKSMPSGGPNTAAILTFGADGPEIEVKTGQKFSLPREPTQEYQVLDIRPTQVILKVAGSGQVVTISMPKE